MLKLKKLYIKVNVYIVNNLLNKRGYMLKIFNIKYNFPVVKSPSQKEKHMALFIKILGLLGMLFTQLAQILGGLHF